MEDKTAAVAKYWDAHPLGLQFLRDTSIEVGSPEFFEHIRPWMNPARFPEILPRIERNARLLQGRHLLEVGCGLGFEAIEYLKRGVRVTATDLTPTAVHLARCHFDAAGLRPEALLVASVLDLPFSDASFDAVSATGVLHHTGDTPLAISEIHRVLRRGGRAILSHFYRKPSWMLLLSRLGREPIEFGDGDPPVTDFYFESEVLAMLGGLEIVQAVPDHYRIVPVARGGWKGLLVNSVFRPLYNLMPEGLSKGLAHKFSVVATKR
jgi:ubiquinone/menaquinone biosynthesis C-methylase UbiE